MPAEALLFDVDGTLVDSVDLHARAWQEAFEHFGIRIPYQAIRAQIGKGGDELMKALLEPEELKRRGKKIAATRLSVRTIGVLCGGFPEADLRKAGCVAIYRDPADLLARLDESPIVR